MRLRLCAVLSGVGSMLVALGGTPRPVPAEGTRTAARAADFEPPEMVLDGSGHDGRLHPHYADFDGDGATDQLMGLGDRLLVYRNRGTNARPAYAPPAWFDEAEPSARIPAGWSRGEFRPRFGDFDGDGRPDLVSSSNCCDARGFHLFLRNPDGTFAPRRRVTFARLDRTLDAPALFLRGHNRPHLLDWGRDGRTDLVVEDGPYLHGRWDLRVGAGPLRGKSGVGVRPVPLPALPDRNPYDFEFADWDGDGRLDVLMAGAYLADPKTGPWVYDVYWFRNTSRRGEPAFAPPVRLLTAPAQSPGWEYTGYAVVDRGPAGRPGLVVSVHKDRDKGGPWTTSGRLWLFRRKAEPAPAADGGA